MTKQWICPYRTVMSFKVQTDITPSSACSTWNNSNKKLVRSKIGLCELNCEVVHHQSLVHHVLNTIFWLLNSPDKRFCKPRDVKTLTFEPRSATLEQPMGEEGMSETTFLQNAFYFVNVRRQYQNDSQALVDEHLNNNVNWKDWKIKANEPKTLDDIAVLLSTLYFSKERMHDEFCQLSPATKSSNANKAFYKGDDKILCYRHLNI